MEEGEEEGEVGGMERRRWERKRRERWSEQSPNFLISAGKYFLTVIPKKSDKKFFRLFSVFHHLTELLRSENVDTTPPVIFFPSLPPSSSFPPHCDPIFFPLPLFPSPSLPSASALPVLSSLLLPPLSFPSFSLSSFQDILSAYITARQTSIMSDMKIYKKLGDNYTAAVISFVKFFVGAFFIDRPNGLSFVRFPCGFFFLIFLFYFSKRNIFKNWRLLDSFQISGDLSWNQIFSFFS
jgi:hypothetical protein